MLDGLTQAKASELNALRSVFGPAGNLVLLTWLSETPVLTVTTDWGIEKPGTVSIIEQDGVSADTVYSSGLVKFWDTVGVIDTITPPTVAPRKWVIGYKGLTAGEWLARQRQMVVAGLTRVCTIQANTGTKSQSGGTKAGWSAVYENVPCQELPLTGTEREQQGTILGVGQSQWKMPAVLSDDSPNLISDKHRFVVTAKDPLPARTFYVTDVSNHSDIFLVVTAKAEG